MTGDGKRYVSGVSHETSHTSRRLAQVLREIATAENIIPKFEISKDVVEYFQTVWDPAFDEETSLRPEFDLASWILN